MWNFFEEHWDVRNTDQHGATVDETESIRLERLHLEVDRIYSAKDTLLFADRCLLDKPISEVKEMSAKSLEIWLHHVNLALDRCLLDAAEQPDSQRLVTDYFRPPPSGVT